MCILTNKIKTGNVDTMETLARCSENTLWEINVAELSRIVNPMRDDEWGCGVIDEMDVACCEDISMGRLPAGMTAEDPSSHEYNVARIAWLVKNGWDEEDNYEPMVLSCSSAFRRDIHFADGNHRFAAAIISGKETVKVVLVGNRSKLPVPYAVFEIPDNLISDETERYTARNFLP